jgi:hypothetical protein
VIAKAEWTGDEPNPRFVVTSPKADAFAARPLYEDFYCVRGEMEKRMKEAHGDLFADRTSTATLRANQLRVWFSSMAYDLLCALRHDPSEAVEARCTGEDPRAQGEDFLRLRLSVGRGLALMRHAPVAHTRLSGRQRAAATR